MQLIIPQSVSDFRKYSYFFDEATSTDFTSISDLISVLRNVRSTPRTITQDTVVLNEMMGVVDSGTTQRLYLTRIGYVGGAVDFSSDVKFVETFLPTVTGKGLRSENAGSTYPPISTSAGSQIVFPFGSGDYVAGMTCLSPTKVGQNTIGQVSYTFTDQTTYIASAGIQRAGGITQRRIDIRTDATPAPVTATLVSYSSSTDRVGLYLNMAQALTATSVGFNWSAFTNRTESRAGQPAKANAADPNVPFYQAALTSEGDITLTKGLVLVANGDNMFVIKLSSSDFSFPSTTPGKSATGTINALPDFVSNQRKFDL